jgi:hypothetical protein
MSLFKSRKFWLMVTDLVVSLTLFFVGKYTSPELFEDIKFVIAALQPVIITVIGAIAYEDGKAMDNFSHPCQAELPAPSISL